MGHQLILLAVTLLAVKSEFDSPACSMNRCQCSTSSASSHPFVECFVSSVSSRDVTVTALPTDIQLLSLVCERSESLSFLTAGTFERFSQLRSLVIKYCNISALSASSFRGLPALEGLFLLHSVLPPMNADTFFHLPDLLYLAITNCNVTSLPDISHLSSLKYLNVSSNKLNRIELETTDDTASSTKTSYLYSLITLDISYNNISSTPLGLIARTPRLSKFLLKGLPLTELSIPENVLLRNLIILDAEESPLVTVNVPGIYASTYLESLFLEGAGRLTQLPNLSRLVSLGELSLNNFAITDMIWQQLNSSSLTKLTLINNHLTTIDISRLPALQLLDVSQNNISHLDDETFYNQTNLLVINLSYNRIQELSVDIFNNSLNTKLIDLSNNNISILETGVFRGLNQLEYLFLSSNGISSLPGSIFRDLSSLEILRIRNNGLRFIPNLSYMQDLVLLDVSYNQISVISASDLHGLPKLLHLNVGNNLLKTLPPNVLSSCQNVDTAAFNHNQITNLGTFGAHPSLRVLRLDHNQITDFIAESPIARLQKLEQLFLNVNNLTRISNKMFPSSLQILILEENYFENVYSTSFNYLPHLTMLSLSMNKRILSMPLSAAIVFKNQSPKPTFDIEGNTFVCDCNMAYMKDILENLFYIHVLDNPYPLFIGIRRSKCSTPFEGGAIRDFKEVPLSHFVCEYNVTWCDDTCHCCYDAPKCECALSCPSECECYHGGSGLKKFYIHIHCRSKNLEQIPSGIPPRTVVLYLDGNNFSHLSKQDFAHLQNVEDIYLNSSYIKSADNGTFENISGLESLYLNDNQLTSIDDNFLGRLPSVKQIYLHNNLIDTISPEAFSQLSSVETITLHNNRIMFLKTVLKIPHSLSLTLSGNPWSCNCEVIKVLMRTFYEIKKAIADIETLCCSFHENSYLDDLDPEGRTLSPTNTNESFIEFNSIESKADKLGLISGKDYNSTFSDSGRSCLPLSTFTYKDHCRPAAGNLTLKWPKSSGGFHAGFFSLIVITIMLLLVAAAVVAVLAKREEFQSWVFVRLGVRILDKKVHLDKQDPDQKVFDAFISYSSKDEEFVAASLVPKLENGHNKYRLCVHYRDFPVGRDITDTIYRAVQNSSRTILLLSMNFLSSEWCRFEFQTAHHHVLREGSHRLIVVMLGDVPEDKLDPDLKVHLQSRTYLKFGDRWFWEKLFFAMPSIKGRQINDGDQRAEILEAMRVLAQDELVDREIKLPGQQHNPQNRFVDGEIHLPGQQHSPQDWFVDEAVNLPMQQHNPQDNFINKMINC